MYFVNLLYIFNKTQTDEGVNGCQAFLWCIRCVSVALQWMAVNCARYRHTGNIEQKRGAPLLVAPLIMIDSEISRPGFGNNLVYCIQHVIMGH